jgi:hypothetical protein
MRIYFLLLTVIVAATIEAVTARVHHHQQQQQQFAPTPVDSASLNGYIPKKSNRVNLLTQAIGARLLKNGARPQQQQQQQTGSSIMSLQNGMINDPSSLLDQPIEDIQMKLQTKMQQRQQQQPLLNMDDEW